jgi:hypothetical protein
MLREYRIDLPQIFRLAKKWQGWATWDRTGTRTGDTEDRADAGLADGLRQAGKQQVDARLAR